MYNRRGLTSDVINHFRNIIYSFYKQYGRKFPFRKVVTPYNVLVSEIMLQQTQASRVSEKFLEFIDKFPDFSSLSKAPLEEVLNAWQGLGYNRRGVALKKIGELIIKDYNGQLPDSVEILKTFPQIGHNTASSIVAFAFNKPTVFIETNIRRVYIYFFFSSKQSIRDKDIISIVEKTSDSINPREWYYALMDYGVMLKKTHPELNKKSSHYRKQAPFKGSNRQLRGKILKLILKSKSLKRSEIRKTLKITNITKINTILTQLEKEGFIKTEGELIRVV